MSESNPAGAVVPDLIRQREQLTGWIARLDEVGPQTSSRVTERVRADYVERLRRVNEDLAAHRGEIEADLARFRAALAEAEELRGRAADELDELSLRHLIGELSEAQWDEARPALERRVGDADDAVARARQEVEHLQQLADDIAGAAAPVPAPPAPAVTEAPAAEAAPPPLPSMDEPAAPASDEPAPAFGGASFEADTPAAEPAPQPSMFEDADDFEPALPAEPEAPVPAAEAPPADPPAAAEVASVDEWDPFGGEFAAEPKQADAEEDLPWLDGIDEASRGGGWTPPAADEGLDFLREIEESTRGGAATPPASSDLGADDLAFLEELDRAIGSVPTSGASRTPTPPPPAQPASAPAGGSRAEPLLCKECGAINEPHSWYCEICGSEL
ncbi:hypothetical protein [Longimicrobium sp.]|uniref:zinc finger Ran-binding domain-containing protein n=1 Tax=Longimicrobium sp. TaxID=2029185 RepID=UPI002E3211F7|nr:hypothetical protein [Longimicrobium sp.]HEX6041602.1 hypothetical protein [Longimicrobium sp.]